MQGSVMLVKWKESDARFYWLTVDALVPNADEVGVDKKIQKFCEHHILKPP